MNPYIPFQINEIAVLKSVKNWSSSRVRIFGKIGKSISIKTENDLELRYFHSVGEEIKSNIIVNFGLISEIFAKNFDEGSVVQILGDLQPFENTIEKILYSFIISAHIIRDLSKVDPELYHEASTLQSIACPKEYFMSGLTDTYEEGMGENQLLENDSDVDSNKSRTKIFRSAEFDSSKNESDKECIANISNTNNSSIDMFADSD